MGKTISANGALRNRERESRSVEHVSTVTKMDMVMTERGMGGFLVGAIFAMAVPASIPVGFAFFGGGALGAFGTPWALSKAAGLVTVARDNVETLYESAKESVVGRNRAERVERLAPTLIRQVLQLRK